MLYKSGRLYYAVRLSDNEKSVIVTLRSALAYLFMSEEKQKYIQAK